MDIEANHRHELIERLGASFLCFEEVEIEHPLFSGLLLRADVVAIPIEDDLWGHALAFEVKCYDESADYAAWSAAIKQASDYVYGRIRSTHHILSGRRISAAFVFPATEYLPYIPKHDASSDISNRVMISGVFHCALQWRVGRAHLSTREGFSLSFGPNEFWTTRRGFSGQARALIKNKRRVGSRGIDVCSMLDGFDAEMPTAD